MVSSLLTAAATEDDDDDDDPINILVQLIDGNFLIGCEKSGSKNPKCYYL